MTSCANSDRTLNPVMLDRWTDILEPHILVNIESNLCEYLLSTTSHSSYSNKASIFVTETPFYRSFRSENKKNQKSGYKQLQNDASLDSERKASSDSSSPSLPRGSKIKGPPGPPQPLGGSPAEVQEDLLIDLSEDNRDSPSLLSSVRVGDDYHSSNDN